MQFGQSETQNQGKKNGLSDGKKCMLIFRRLYTGRRKEKIQGTYFKICALNFKISQTYFMPSANPGKTIQTETDKKP
jgi:hypothetical protein